MSPTFPPATRIACLTTAAVAVLVLVGWIEGIPVLTSVVPGWSSMTMNTAACFFLTAVAMCLASPATAPGRRVSFAASALVLAFSGLTLVQYLGGWDFGIDQPRWHASADPNVLFPGRMAPNSAVAFLLLHAALRLLPPAQHPWRVTLTAALAGVVALIGAFETIGYLALLTTGHGWGEQTSMSVHSGALFLVLGAVGVANAWRTAGATWSVWRSLTAVFALGLAILIGIAIYSYKSLAEYQSSGERLRHTHEVQAKVRGVGGFLVEGELAMRDFTMAGEERLVVTMKARLADAWAGVAELRKLTAREPNQQRQLDRLEPLIRAQGKFALEVIEERRARGAAAAIALMQAGRGLAIKAQVEEVLTAMDREEDHFLEHRQEGLEKASARLPYILPIGTFLGVAILLTAFVFLNAEVVERRRVEKLLRKSEESFRLSSETQTATLNALPAHLALLDPQGVIVAVNETWKRFASANALQSKDFAVGQNYLEVSSRSHGECSEEANAAAVGIRSVLNGEQAEFSLEYPCHSETEQRWFRLMVTPVVEGRRQGAVVMHVNITERRLAEVRLLRLNRLHIVLSKTSEAVAHAPERQEIFDAVCRTLVADGHLRMAFIAEIEPDGENVRVAASAGEGREVLSRLRMVVRDGSESRGTVGTALRTGVADAANDFENDPRMAPWRATALASGFRANASFPIQSGERTVAAVVLCASEVDYFQDDEMRLMGAVAANVSFALEVQARKAASLHAEQALRMQAHTLDHIGQAVIATDTTGIIFYANRAASELYGWPIDELKGRSVMEITVPQASREQAEAIMHRLGRGENWSGEFLVQTRAGRIFPAEITDSPLLDASGAMVGIVGISTDITERKQAAETIRHAERTQRQFAQQLAAERARLLEVQAVAHVGSWETDLQTLEVTWSEETYRIYEQPPDFRPNYANTLRLVHPEDRERIDLAFKEAMGRPGEFSIQHRLIFPDGRIKHVEERWWNIFDEGGKPVRAAGSCLDITERQVAQEALRRADESLRTTLDSMTEVFVTIDRAWRLTYLNAEAERLLGQPRETLLGESLWSAFPAIAGTAFETNYRRAAEEGVSVSFEAYFEPLQVWLEVRVFPSRDGLAVYSTDITQIKGHREALRAGEREFRTLAESMPQIVWAAGPDGRSTYLNQKWTDYTGLTFEESQGVGFYEALHPDDRQPTSEAWARTLSGGGKFAIELRIRAADGTYRWWLNRASPQRDEQGRIVKWFGTCTDIHDLKMADLEISRTNRALKMLSTCNEAMIHADDETELLHAVCHVAVTTGGYQMAWVGYPQQDEAGSVKPMAVCGDDRGYLKRLNISWRKGRPDSEGPAGRALRSGQSVLVRDVSQDPNFTNLAAAMELGFRSVTALPLRLNGRTFGALFLYSPQVSEITETELKLLQELADDLGFGIGNLRARNDRAKLQSVVMKVAGAVSAATGAEFFEQLTRNMGEALEAQASFVACLLPEAEGTARTIAGVIEGNAAESFDFRIQESPFRVQEGRETLIDEVVRPFPEFPAAPAIGAQGFVGRWLTNSAGEQIGLLFLFFREPLTETEFINSTLRIFAARAASELERQQAEMQLREQAELLDAAHEAIYVKSLDDGVRYWNKGAERLYGWSAEEIIGHRVSERLYANPEKIAAAREKVMSTGFWEGEVEKHTKDGRILVVEARWTLMRDDAGAPKSILAINSDITERKQIEQQFLRAQRMESIGTLAGGIAHDLNNALGPVIMSLDLLKMRFTDPASRELLAIISSSAQRGADMVRQVLSFARGVEGKRMEVQVKHLLQDIEKIVRDTFLKNITVRSIIPHDLWTVQGDPTQLHQVLLNLCVNARDAMPEGGALTISAENRIIDEHYAGLNVEARPGAYVFLQIEDTGTGIPANVIEKIFDPFFTTKEIGKGTGLGLSTPLAIVKTHGGFLQVDSEFGKGTKFKIYLPARTEASAEAIAEAAAEMPRGNGELILVVDDEASVREITQQTLEAFGYRVILANDGAEAVATYAQRSGEIAVILTDMMMPVMDGPAAIRVIRSMNPAARIIAASGLSANGHVAQAAALGIKHFLPKPYTAETLLKALREILIPAA